MSWISALVFFFLGVIVAMLVHSTTYDMCQDYMGKKFDHLVRLMNQWTQERDLAAAQHTAAYSSSSTLP
jgi:hypothetical protein